MNSILKQAFSINDDLIRYRRYLHSNAETGFKLQKTVAYIKDCLREIGCEPCDIGNCGVYTIIGNKRKECIMLRADTDALPIKEETSLPFASKENMHACGHDMHTAMLLGAARILKSRENEIKTPVKLLFQPAEELLLGAKNMIESKILVNPEVVAAYMLHITVNTPFKTGTLTVSNEGTSAPSADYFEITVKGKGCHGAMVNTGIDPIISAAHIITALDSIKTRELSLYDSAALTVGCIQAGKVHNIIPDQATIKGTTRAFDEDVRETVKESIVRIAEGVAASLKSVAEVNFSSGCPTLKNDRKLSEKAILCLKREIGDGLVISSADAAKQSRINQRSSGSEDFAFFSHKVPSLMIGLSAGSTNEGYDFPLHHPKVVLNEDALPYGAAAIATLAFYYE